MEMFIRHGGRVIAAGYSVAAMLPKNDIKLHAALVETPPEWDTFSALAASDITTAAPEITMSPLAYWASSHTAEALYGTQDEPVAVQYRYGEGTGRRNINTLRMKVFGAGNLLIGYYQKLLYGRTGRKMQLIRLIRPPYPSQLA